MRLPGTSEVNAAAVEVPSHGQQEQLPAVSTQDNQHIQTGNNDDNNDNNNNNNNNDGNNNNDDNNCPGLQGCLES